MTRSVIRILAVAPALLFATGSLAASLGSFGPWSALGLIVGMVPLFALVNRRWFALLAVPFGVSLLGVLVGWAVTGSVLAGSTGALAAGLLLGSPIVFLALVEVLSDAFGIALLALIEGLTQSAALVATAASLNAATSPGGVLNAYAGVLRLQGNGVSALIHGEFPTGLPLELAGGGLFFALAVLAFVGFLFGELESSAAVRIRAGEEIDRPRIDPARRRSALDLGLPPPVARALEGRSTPIGRLAPLSSALTPVLVGAGTVAAFLFFADVVPIAVLPLLGGGAAATLIAIFLLGRVPAGPPVQGGVPSPIDRV